MVLKSRNSRLNVFYEKLSVERKCKMLRAIKLSEDGDDNKYMTMFASSFFSSDKENCFFQ